MRIARDTLTAPDGLRMATWAWLPDDEAATLRGSVVITHGLAEHAGRYERLAGALVDAGFAVHAFDLRGHGASAGPRAQVHDVDELVADLRTVFDHVRAWQGGSLALFGHSLGGLVTLRAVQSGSVAPEALVLSSPFLRSPSAPPALVVRALTALGRVWPGAPAKRLDPSAMSRDPREVAAYRDDPQVTHDPVRLDTAIAMVRGAEAALALDVRPLTLPTLVLHGLADRVSDPGGSAELVARHPGVTHHVEPDGHHELFNDTCREHVTDVLVRWLTTRLPQRDEA